jgi:hypothetical protein
VEGIGVEWDSYSSKLTVHEVERIVQAFVHGLIVLMQRDHRIDDQIPFRSEVFHHTMLTHKKSLPCRRVDRCIRRVRLSAIDRNLAVRVVQTAAVQVGPRMKEVGRKVAEGQVAPIVLVRICQLCES